MIVYCSNTGNTENVAQAIKCGFEQAAIAITIRKAENAREEDLFDYDLVCLGSPVHQWLPAKQIREFVNSKLKEAFKRGYVKPDMKPVA